MANKLEEMSQSNFSVEDTISTSMGDTKLIDDLFGDGTSSANPDELKNIIDEVPDDNPPEKPEKKAGKEIVQEIDGVKPPENKDLLNFLTGEDEEEEDEQDIPSDSKSVDDEGKQEPKSTEEQEVEDESSSPSQFQALANDLFNLGVFTKGEEEEDITTPEAFLEKFNQEKKTGAIQIVDDFIGQFGDDYKQAFDAIFVKGVNPNEYFTTYNKIVNFADLDISKEENQVRVLKQALNDQGFDPEDIESEIERLTNYGDLESVAAKHHKVLVKKEATKLEQLEREAQTKLQQKQEYKQQYINNVREILEDKLKAKEFDGIPLNPKLANELQDFLLVDKYKTQSGETLTDFDKAILELKRPENHAMKVKVGLLLKIIEKDPTLSTIQKTGVTKKSNQLFQEVVRQKTTASKKSSDSDKSKSNSWFL